ncbi:hypothetical protein WT97_07815 [Burkholderia sp. MSMB1459WGS]|uniref:hypothetical protein n=1 Tax=Burkholderia sp. MSMB1459WGS TaxID=1637970 RepID=UPI00075FE860|nr:hypothetical protein [Burkholderia sp. MSMB1459WGS]KWO47959.1 hypothetical protein WT97_07815 [Burkholderia sp. MSMB1459WGS]
MDIMGYRRIIGRLATRVAHPFAGVRPQRGPCAYRPAIVVAIAGSMFGSMCVAAPHAHEMRQPAAIGMHDGANTPHPGLIARPAAAPVAAAQSDVDDSGRRARESAVLAAARAKARYPRKPNASSDTAKALGMTDAELASWLTDIRRQASAPILRPHRHGEAELHPMYPARPTDS